MATGWERGNRTHFDEIVVNYDRIRPEWPDEIFTDIFRYTLPEKGKKALEIGAGTGKATTSVLDAGYDVTAVEIGSNMTEFLRNRFKAYDKFAVINDSFEDALLGEDSYDLVYAASAFHWVDAKIGCPKVWRILKNGGTFALFRFNEISSEDKELGGEIQRADEKYLYKTHEKPAKISIEEKISIFRGFGFNDLREYGFSDVLMNLYDETLIFSADDFLAFLDTMANRRSLPEDDKTALYAAIKEAIAMHGGYHKLNYIFQLYMGRKEI